MDKQYSVFEIPSNWEDVLNEVVMADEEFMFQDHNAAYFSYSVRDEDGEWESVSNTGGEGYSENGNKFDIVRMMEEVDYERLANGPFVD